MRYNSIHSMLVLCVIHNYFSKMETITGFQTFDWTCILYWKDSQFFTFPEPSLTENCSVHWSTNFSWYKIPRRASRLKWGNFLLRELGESEKVIWTRDFQHTSVYKTEIRWVSVCRAFARLRKSNASLFLINRWFLCLRGVHSVESYEHKFLVQLGVKESTVRT